MNWLIRLFRRPTVEETVLVEKVRAERKSFEIKRRRAERVLQDFHAADDVIKGRAGGTHGT